MSVVRLLHLHYGFIPPLPMPHEIWQLGPKNRVFTKATGISLVDGSIFTTGLRKVMYNFIEDLVAKRQPNQSLWDLQRGNRDAPFRRRVNFFRQLPSGIILFDFGQYSTVLWKIAVSEAATALYICQLDPEFDEMDIAHRNLFQDPAAFE
jgi:hypothetical protein